MSNIKSVVSAFEAAGLSSGRMRESNYATRVFKNAAVFTFTGELVRQAYGDIDVSDIAAVREHLGNAGFLLAPESMLFADVSYDNAGRRVFSGRELEDMVVVTADEVVAARNIRDRDGLGLVVDSARVNELVRVGRGGSSR